MVAAAVAAGAVSACSLLTSLDGLSDGASAVDSGNDTGMAEGDGAAGRDAESGSTTDVESGADSAPSASTLYANAVLADKPRGYWRLEETAGITAKDETGRNGGTFLNGPMLAQPGVAGSFAAKLPKGFQARIAVTTGDFAFAGTAPYTVELWVSGGTFTAYQWLASTESEAAAATVGRSFTTARAWSTTRAGAPWTAATPGHASSSFRRRRSRAVRSSTSSWRTRAAPPTATSTAS